MCYPLFTCTHILTRIPCIGFYVWDPLTPNFSKFEDQQPKNKVHFLRCELTYLSYLQKNQVIFNVFDSCKEKIVTNSVSQNFQNNRLLLWSHDACVEGIRIT